MGFLLQMLASSCLFLVAAQEPKPCGIQLDSVRPEHGSPGEEFELLGRWGDAQGTKLPVLNKGDVHELEVLSWSDAALRVRIPRGLQPGAYRLGVYCGLAQGSPYSSGWRDFEVLAPGQRPAKPAQQALPEKPLPPPEPQAEAKPGPWREQFAAQWTAKGRRMGSQPWLKGRRILVLRDSGVSVEMAGRVEASLSALLRELGAKELKAEVDGSGVPAGLAACSQDGVLSEACAKAAVARLRQGSGPYAESLLVLVTNSAIGSKPESSPDGSMTGPPAGLADYGQGWFLISDFWKGWNREHGRGTHDQAFLTHSLDHTVRHEFLHLLGLPHHERLENPGFPEPRLCTQCTHSNAGGHAQSPHSECGMFCGSGDDDWFHVRDFGKGFGFCAKCSTAARAVISGIEKP